MTTHEREIVQPVDLCTPDGDRLNPEALGWSRSPLHRANLRGRFGMNKRWDYWAILAGDVAISTTVADIDHLGLADVYWVNLATGESGGHSVVAAPEAGIRLPDVAGSYPLEVNDGSFHLRIADGASGTQFLAEWLEPDGRPGSLEVLVERPAGHETMNVVIPWSDELFNYTQKDQGRRARGRLGVGETVYEFGGSDTSAWGVLDVGRGRWPARIEWNWGGGAGLVDGRVVGLQFGAQWTRGSGFTENALVVDGRLSKIGNELEWIYDWDHPMQPWRVRDPDGQLDVTLAPRFDKHTLVEVSEDLGSEVHQVFGTWSGHLRTDDGVELTLGGIQGFAEEARQRW